MAAGASRDGWKLEALAGSYRLTLGPAPHAGARPVPALFVEGRLKAWLHDGLSLRVLREVDVALGGPRPCGGTTHQHHRETDALARRLSRALATGRLVAWEVAPVAARVDARAARAAAEPAEAPGLYIGFHVVNPDGKALSNLRLQLELPDGGQRAVTTGSDGRARLSLAAPGDCLLTVPPAEGKAASKDTAPRYARRDVRGRVVAVAGGPPVTLATGVTHTVCVYEPVLTVAFLLDSAARSDSDFPRYTLTSSSGAYRKALGAKDDLVPGDDLLQLRFEDLPQDTFFTLARHEAHGDEHVLFEDLPFDQVVDQTRPAATLLKEEGLFAAATVVSLDGVDWERVVQFEGEVG